MVQMGTPLRVLIIEDSEDDAILMLRALKQGGYDPTFARVDTSETMNNALNTHIWDIILADYAMPRFSVPAALTIVKERSLDLPFIIVSGAIGEEAAVAAMRAGAHDYVMKGNLARLVPVIERELREAEIRRKNKQMEEEIKKSEETLRRYLESSPDAIFTIDLEGTFLYGHKAAERMTAYTREEFIGKSFRELHLLPPEYLLKAAQLLELSAAGKSTKQDEFQLIRKDGSYVFIEISLYPIGQGSEVEIIGVARDITNRKRMEQQLQLAGRLAAVGELAAGVAHELNNPLAAVLMYSQLLNTRDDLDETVRSDIDTVFKEAQRATRITGSLLSFARRQKPDKSPISINEVIEKSLELSTSQMKANNIEITRELERELPAIMADFYQLQEVFLNLINNAEQAMTEAHGRGSLNVKTEKSGEMIRIVFSDDGPGIAEGILKRIFDPFFTTKDVGKGTGLGLSICYGVVQEHGGHIYAESKPSKGATFVIELPVVSKGQRPVQETSSTQVRDV
jgi:two-component system cell cycle sensor histidine kinase/response regulator CckA